MKPARLLLALSTLLLLGCSDDSPAEGSGGKGGDASGGSSPTSMPGKPSGGSPSGGSPSAGNGSGNDAGGDAGGNASSGGSSGAMLSEACQKYCTCEETNCPDQEIPGGMSCGDFCAAMSEDQLACRQNMCKLVPDQPDNDHCKHSVGIDQCL